MITDKENKRLSKFLSYVLRHHPELIAIKLDENGWVNVDTLIDKAANFGVQFDRPILNFIVATNSKKRFAFNETMDLIRASQGHSIPIELGYEPQQPPGLLYHGTAAIHVESIRNVGIYKQSRQHVHLSENFETAIQVGQRHGKPIVFKVNSGKMYTNKFEFFKSENGVWLTEFVPKDYLIVD